MAFTPNSKVYLLDTPLDNKYQNEIHFTTKEAQTAYFLSRIKHDEFEGVTYLRKDNVIRVDGHIDYLWDSNYVMYQNSNFGSKWFYAFITKKEYVSDRATDVYIETDVYQTWLFDCELKTSFVVREHVADDSIGAHLVDEQLDTGEYVFDLYSVTDKLGLNWNVLAVSDNTPFASSELSGNMYGNVVTGLTYYPFPNNTAGIEWLKLVIGMYTDAGKADAIAMIFTIPALLIPSLPDTYAGWATGSPIASGEFQGITNIAIPKQLNGFDGYTPKNNKLYTHPYKFLYLSNGNGQSATYRYENFPAHEMDFQIFGSIMPNPSIMMCPNNYKGAGASYEDGLILTGFPLCSWTTDMYAAWLAQNTASTAITLVGSAAALVGGIATGNPYAIGGGVLGISKELTEIYKAAIQPDQAKGQSGSGSLMFANDKLDFRYTHFYIKPEFAKRIDNYLTLFGYKVNALKVPETHSRQRWNYIKTIDVNIDGSLPTEDMVRLKKIYDDGVTLWHTTSDFLDYSKSNPII